MVESALGIAVSQTEPDVGHGTHLAVLLRCIIIANHDEDYGHKSSDARDGVDLL